MTDPNAFYQAVRSQAANLNQNFSFDQVSPYFAPEDQTVKIQNVVDLTGVSLQAVELLDLARFWYNEGRIFYPQRDAYEAFNARFAAVVVGAFNAKRDLGNALIGLGKQAVINPAMLRPSTVLSTSSSIVKTWVPASNPAAGWTDPYFTINLNLNNTTAGTNGTPAALQNQITGLILGLGDFGATTNLREYQVQDPASTRYGVVSLPFSRSLDDPAIAFGGQAFVMRKNEQWKIAANFDAAAAALPVVLGVQYATNILSTAE